MTKNAIASMKAESFAAFASVEINFGAALNVIVGENGAGKSQLIKLLYSVASVLSQGDPLGASGPRKVAFNSTLASKLVGVFRPEELGRLTNRRRGRTRSEVAVSFKELKEPVAFSFASTARTEVKTSSVPETWITDTPVYLPTRELLSIYPGFVSLYNERRVEFDETWRDTADLLGRPSLRGPRESRISSILAPIQDALGGTIVEEQGRFYLKQPGVGQLEMHLVAEGLRKLGMLARLVTSGTLLSSGYLFWDEPETNLNPRTLRHVARTIVELSHSGVQVFIATHSLFLLREIEILLSHEDYSGVSKHTQFIGMHRTDDGVVVEQGHDIADIGDITALDEELNQSDRYLKAVQ